MTGTLTYQKYEFYKETIKGMRLPALILDQELLLGNLKEIVTRAKGHKIRIASKSVRCREVLKTALAFDPCFQGIMCFSAEEAVFLSQNNFDDLLVAYPTVQKSAIKSVIAEIKKNKKIYLMVDSIEHLNIIQQFAKEEDTTVSVCLEIDMSLRLPGLNFGVYRSPVRTVEDVERIGTHAKTLKNIRLVGVMGYEAQIAGLGDYNPAQGLKNPIIRLLKKYSLNKIQNFRTKAVQKLKELNHNIILVNGGGTGSFNSTGKDPSVTELAMGSGIFAPTLFDYYNEFKYRPALFYALEVSRRPEPNMVTCNGGGYMASGPIGIDKIPKVYLPENLTLTENENVGEVQTPLHLNNNVLSLGDPVFFRHAKAGEVCERFKEIHILKNREILSSAPTYRGDGQCFY